LTSSLSAAESDWRGGWVPGQRTEGSSPGPPRKERGRCVMDARRLGPRTGARWPGFEEQTYADSGERRSRMGANRPCPFPDQGTWNSAKVAPIWHHRSSNKKPRVRSSDCTLARDDRGWSRITKTTSLQRHHESQAGLLSSCSRPEEVTHLRRSICLTIPSPYQDLVH